FFGREPDEAGMANWLKHLEGGQSRKWVFDGFASSREFYLFCIAQGLIEIDIPSNDDVIDDDPSAAYQVTTFAGLSLADGGQFVNGIGIQRMSWSGHLGLNFAGTTMDIVNGVLVVKNGSNARGFQFAEWYSHDKSIDFVVGEEYTIIIEAAALIESGVINIIPDNNSANGDGNTFPLTTERTQYTLTWTQEAHEHNNLQISSDVDFVVFNVTVK
ncbi:MAG: DUF4214 domain-containing protein, partial [Oscillospiraceae bacterium]|nr:DUF4214 domain-containing protein [Oscillospiraceae bacterium]